MIVVMSRHQKLRHTFTASTRTYEPLASFHLSSYDADTLLSSERPKCSNAHNRGLLIEDAKYNGKLVVAENALEDFRKSLRGTISILSFISSYIT